MAYRSTIHDYVRDGVGRYAAKARRELHEAFAQEHSEHQIAGSFALGTFITMLPTWGFGLLAFFALIYVTDRINRVALFASVLVFNPMVKWGVYGASVALGIFLLGSIEGGTSGDTARAVVLRLLVGNFILACLATVLSYLVVYLLVARYRRTASALMEEVAEEI